MQFGLLGRKLGHSYSPQIHSYLGEYLYELYEVEPENIEFFMKSKDFAGINVTIPYKKTVLPYCASLSNMALKLGAVNTIIRNDQGNLIGHNTDYFGFMYMVRKSGLQVLGKKVLVLGSGGASNTAVAVMQELGANVIVISRSGKNNYENIQLHNDAAAIVNATPVGMYPNNGVSPIDLSFFPQLEGVLDMIYNPSKTKLMLDAEERGLVAENGLWMLIAQAKESAEWFTGKRYDDRIIEQIYRALSTEMENIVLVGMPGCGKSSVGQALAKELNRSFFDADQEIINAAGCSIADIFEKSREKGFRQMETAILKKLGKNSCSVISTGGGCVTREENFPLLRQNGIIIWIQRDIELLATDGRPLSNATKLHDMYTVREPMYRRFADHIVTNNGSIQETIEQIRRLL